MQQLTNDKALYLMLIPGLAYYIILKYVEYVTKIRIEAAKDQLLDTNNTIDAIAYDVGYNTTNSFIKIFKRYEGITPGKYRQAYEQNRGKEDKNP